MAKSTFDTPQYKRVMAACKERSEIPTMAWIPDEVKKECVHTQLHEAQEVRVDFTQDSEYKKLYGLYGQQTELIEQWVDQEEKQGSTIVIRCLRCNKLYNKKVGLIKKCPPCGNEDTQEVVDS